MVNTINQNLNCVFIGLENFWHLWFSYQV